jgi:leucyl aminopeptidase
MSDHPSQNSPEDGLRLALSSGPVLETNASLIVIPCHSEAAQPDATLPRWNNALEAVAGRFAAAGRDLRLLLAEEGLQGRHGQSLYLPESPAGRLLFVGLGDPDIASHRLEAACARALTAVRVKDLELVAVVLPTDVRLAPDVTLLALSGALYQFAYRSREARAPEQLPRISRAQFHHGPGEFTAPGYADASELLREIAALCEARALTMDLVNTPSNIKRTDTLVAEVRQLEAKGLAVEVVDDVRWIEEHMPCFFTVAKGSLASDPPKWIHVHYQPAGDVKRRIALVGKAVIFDTGGYQVKTDNFMNTMKADMAGSAAVIGAMQAIADLRPPHIEVHAYCAATPNKIDSDAMLPDSIVDTTCGKKVEIRHTDAEGRLTLIDAVAMAERANPEVIVTVATLTGAASRAVGMGMALMTRDRHRAWRDRMEAAARAAGDRVQTLDLLEEDFDDIKSKLDGADLLNTMRGKTRGAQTAAAFVMNGAPEERPLIHLDIAGGDMSEDDKATGIATKSLLRFLLHHLG